MRPRHRWLRACRERPRGHRAAEQRDERAALHSITSSARVSSAGERKRGAIHRLSPYWIKFARTAKYKTNPDAIAINTNQIAIFANLGTSR
jgi:hypothetical protein